MATTTTTVNASSTLKPSDLPKPTLRPVAGLEISPEIQMAPINAPTVAAPQDPAQQAAEFEVMKGQYGGLRLSMEDQIKKISEAPLEVDTGALVGEISTRFNQIKNRITESALQSVQKAGLELDTYFGSQKGDQRSGARMKMAASVKNDMMRSAFDAIAGVYDKNTEMVVSTQLEGAKLNLQAAATKAQAIAEFTGQATQAYLGVLSETNKNYATRLSASVEWAQIQAQMRGQDISYEAQLRGYLVEQRGQNLQAQVAERGQNVSLAEAELSAGITARGQDIQQSIAEMQIKSDADRIQLERDKANLEASMQVWLRDPFDRVERPSIRGVFGGSFSGGYDLVQKAAPARI